MKFILLLLLLASSYSLSSEIKRNEILLEGKVSYFYPTSTHFRSIYPGAGLYRIESSYQVWQGLYPFISVGYFYQSGRSRGGNDRTHIHMVPLTPGLMYQACLDNIRPYLGFGIPITYVHIHNKYKYVDESRSRWGVGWQGRVGFFYYIKPRYFLDFFGDYTCLRMSFGLAKKKNIETRRADLSGISVGAGFGYQF